MTALARTADLPRLADATAEAPAATATDARADESARSWLHGSALRRLALAAGCAAALWTSVAWALVRGS